MSEEFIFMSYAREPNTDTFVKKLKSDLDTAGFKVWMDIDDIPAGSDWHGAIGTALHNCRAIIVVITQKYLGSRYGSNEMYQANSDQKAIFPVFLQDVDFGITETSRGVKYVISGINWTMFRPNIDDYNASLTKLIGGLKGNGILPKGEGGLTSQMNQMKIASPQQHELTQQSPLPQQQYGQPPPTTGALMPPPFAPPFAPIVDPQYAGQMVPPIGPPYNYPMTNPYGSPSAPGVGPVYTSPGSQGYPDQSYPAPFYGHQQHPPTLPPMWPAPPQGQQQGYPGVPVFPGQYNSPDQPPPPSYHQLFGHPSGQQLPRQNADVPVVGAAAAEAPKEFKVGMKVEAVDRRFPYFVCVATIADKREKGGEVLVHFDGWSNAYDYWCGTDAIELHPMGWCETHGWELQKPHGRQEFEWGRYLKEQDAEAAPRSSFKKHQLDGPGSLHFKAGMRVEAKDRKNPSMICVATITEVRNRRLLMHFDGWSDHFNYWCSPDTTDIHPPMWCGKNGKRVEPPYGYQGHFKWNEYLNDPNINPAPAHIFTADQIGAANVFKAGMKLEAKDRLNPHLICVATVADIRNNQVLIHFDGWSDQYNYWCDTTSTDIHPAGWCSKYGYDLQPPNGYDRTFNWNSYLSTCKATRAPEGSFTKQQMAKQKPSAGVASSYKAASHGSSSLFHVGMKLEAKDRQYPTLICVATITDIRGNEVLIHFDNWNNGYDYWCETTSTDIHPVGWCRSHNHALQPPKGYGHQFKWDVYLSECDAEPVPDNAFTSSQK